MSVYSRFKLVLIPVGLAVGVWAAPQPNIVHILVDDLGWQDIVCFDVDGETWLETPNLDRLAKRGRKFMQAYSPAPTCAPSRAAYISGQYPVHTGIYHVYGGKLPRAWYEGHAKITSHINPFYPYRLPLTENTIAKELQKAGYFTGHVGKWHLGGRSNGYPFPVNYGFDFGYMSDPDSSTLYYNDPDIWGSKKDGAKVFNGLAATMKPDRLSDFATDSPNDPYRLDDDGRPFDKPLDTALGFIKKHKDKPFFLNYCTYYVHGPIQARNRERFEYYCKKMGMAVPTDPGPVNDKSPGAPNPYYATMIDTLDWMVGQVIKVLETTGDPRNPGHKLIENTYIMISSDNGGLLGYGDTVTCNAPLRGGKQHLHEGGIRIPFIVSGPSVPEDSTCDTPISLIDLYPTMLAMAGQPPSKNPKLDGVNIFPLMTGQSSQAIAPDGSVRDALYFYFPNYHTAGSAIRKGNWKAVRNLAPGVNSNPEVELFRLYNDDGSVADLGEANNLAAEMPELSNRLLAELDEFMTAAKITKPYKDPKGVTPAPGQDKVPSVLARAAKGSRIWVDVETGAEKSPIVDAKLLYTVNGSYLEQTKGRREMWFEASATIDGCRIEGVVPPGTTHAAFCMVDKEGFLIMSEELPSNQKVSMGKADTTYLVDGYAFRPGLFALIELGEQAVAELKHSGKSNPALQNEIKRAKAVYAKGKASDMEYCDTIRALRGSIRDLKGTVSQADNYHLNLFRQGGAF
ncbi:sulfatase [Pontiellaceae bacterium B12227]|nr:sulfatase [Pontiellaceae bacterium B12227]